MALNQLTEEYLRSVSPLARRISEDLVAAREAYQDLWHTLDTTEKNQVLDEALIDPAIVLKYTSGDESSWSVEPLSQFSWFTKSQLNLCSYFKQQEKPKTPNKRTPEVLSPVRKSTSEIEPTVAKIQQPNVENTNIFGKLKSKVMKSSTGDDKQCLVESRAHPVTIVPKTIVECKSLLAHEASDHTDDIPKTGFDFLDNW
ncbi:hypothetical protein AAG570_002466 [Ranatra chinensis]|uniref:DUF4706 domain-containing protein n=1 Tax=Ranatra chinensis TaxID=642074 RepID=A0ABD0Y8K4_9HEMI